MIKKTSLDEFPILENLEKKCFEEEAWNISQIESHHLVNSSILYFDNDLKPTGYIIYLENPFEVEILRIGVLIESRRQGIAQKLLEEVFTISRNREIILEVKSENSPAIELYKKKDFIIFAVRKKYYPDGKDAILMKRHNI